MGAGRWFGDVSKTLHLLGTLFLLGVQCFCFMIYNEIIIQLTETRVTGSPELVLPNLGPSHVQFTVGFRLLWESNAASDLMEVAALDYRSGSHASNGDCDYRWNFTCLPSAHPLLCGPVPNRLWACYDTSLWPRGPLIYNPMAIDNLVGHSGVLSLEESAPFTSQFLVITEISGYFLFP